MKGLRRKVRKICAIIICIMFFVFSMFQNSAYSSEFQEGSLTTTTQYTYYVSGRMATKTLSLPDGDGNVCYNYLDED